MTEPAKHSNVIEIRAGKRIINGAGQAGVEDGEAAINYTGRTAIDPKYVSF